MTTTIITDHDTPTVLDLFIDYLRESRLSLRYAQAAAEHSPNAHSQFLLEQARARTDALLDAYLDMDH